MTLPDKNRRDFLKAGGAAVASTVVAWNATSYAAIVGANDRVRVGVVGCGDRMKGALIPAFAGNSKAMNFELVAVSDLWNQRREEGEAYIQKKTAAPRPSSSAATTKSSMRARMWTRCWWRRQTFNMRSTAFRQCEPGVMPTWRSRRRTP